VRLVQSLSWRSRRASLSNVKVRIAGVRRPVFVAHHRTDPLERLDKMRKKCAITRRVFVPVAVTFTPVAGRVQVGG
jgi:hypothetical protein